MQRQEYTTANESDADKLQFYEGKHDIGQVWEVVAIRGDENRYVYQENGFAQNVCNRYQRKRSTFNRQF